MTRLPRNPYTTRASCGPAFRYSLASTLIRSKSARTASPAIIKYSIGMPDISPPITTRKSRTTENTKVHEEKRRDFVYLRALGGYFFHHLLIHHAPAFPEPDAACSLNFPPSAAALSSPAISAHRRTYAIPFS